MFSKIKKEPDTISKEEFLKLAAEVPNKTALKKKKNASGSVTIVNTSGKSTAKAESKVKKILLLLVHLVVRKIS